MQFVRQRDEMAFRQLVERHATMLMSVCRRISRNEEDAEDAFQATLLILAARAHRLTNVTSLAAWLHRVAYRTSARAARRRARRHESSLQEEPPVATHDALQQIHVRELQQIMHEELQNIPGRYRDAIVLCDLEGHTRAQAADQLDRTESAVKAALARGRRKLRFQLLKRGVAMSVVFATARNACAAHSSSAEKWIELAVKSCIQQGNSGGAARALPLNRSFNSPAKEQER